MARLLIVLGVLLALIGVLLLVAPRSLSWFGNLPGDLELGRGNTRIFVPLASMLVVSLGLTLIVNLIGWLLSWFR